MSVHIQFAEETPEAVARERTVMMQMLTRRGYYQFSQSVKWNPALNIYEDEGTFHICVELPGLTREQIQVEVAQQKVRLSGERPITPPPGREQTCLLRMEIDSGPFERAVELPETADMNTIEARLSDGFLWITIAKRAP